MGAITIRNLPDAIIARLKRRAKDNGVSMEAEARSILAGTIDEDKTEGFGQQLRQHFEGCTVDEFHIERQRAIPEASTIFDEN